MKLTKYNITLILTFLTFILILTAITTSSFAYHGYLGTEPYIPTNHLISELGNRFKSSLFYIFNSGIILTGILLITIITISKISSFLGNSFLSISSLGLVGVGLFPEHYSIITHLLSATIFLGFSAGAVATITFKYLKLNTEPKKKILITLGIMTFLLFLAILFTPKTLLIEFILKKENFSRPAIWPFAIIEWSYVGFYIIWFTLLQISQNKIDLENI